MKDGDVAIGRETAIRWAKEAGFYLNDEGVPIITTSDGSWLNLEYKIGALVARVRNKALDEAIDRLYSNGEVEAEKYAEQIRQLK